MEIGLIEWFNNEKGFGMIATPKKDKVFLHISNWKDSKDIVPNNEHPIIFTRGLQRDKITALDCKYFNVNNSSDWQTLFSFVDQNILNEENPSPLNLLKIVINSLDANFNTSTLTEQLKKFVGNLDKSDLFDKNHWIYKTLQDTTNEKIKALFSNTIAFQIYKLSNTEVLQFWRQGILSNFEPTDLTFINGYKEIGIAELKSIQEIETRNIVLIKKVKDLFENFNLEEFSKYDDVLKSIEAEKLKVKIREDLNKIAEVHYLEIVGKNIQDLTLDETVSSMDLNNIISELPSFLDSSFLISSNNILEKSIVENCSFKIIIDCWANDLITLDSDYITNKIKDLSINDLEHLLNSKKASKEQASATLDQLMNQQEYEKALSHSRTYSRDLLEEYDQRIFNVLEEKEYFKFWLQRKGEILPENYLKSYINHLESNHHELINWLNDRMLTNEEAKKILLLKIQETSTIDDRFDFYTLYNAIQSLYNIDTTFIESVANIKDSSIQLILWHLQIIEDFDFEALTRKFIYFKPDDQVSIFKRLFYLKHTNQLDFNIEKLDRILRADLDLYLRNEQFNNDFILDISTHIIIESIKAYVKTGDFIFESDLILKDLKNNSEKRFKIGHYFDKCEGRLTPHWDWKKEGEISQVFYGDEKFYYAIDISKSSNFQHLKNEVKKLPDRKWNPDKQHWGVPSKYKEEVYLFAKENRFFINLEDSLHFSNNPHLAEFTRFIKKGGTITKEKNIPNGIIFCEGRKSNKKDTKFNKEFWWCANQICFQNCVHDHLSEEESTDSGQNIWEQYTLIDFLKILNINTDEHNEIDNIQEGNYTKFLGHINAFNRLLERLYCEECNNLLYPVKTSHFALYTDVRFHCIENNCSEKHKEVYLTNCLYGECKTIIDSRVSKSCAHGLYICDNCGTCCSEEFFKRRLDNLKKVGGYIHSALINNVENRDGHLEKKEYYCFKCSGMMTEGQNNSFNCTTCKVSYNLEKFKWLNKKWTRASRRRTDYPGNKGGSNYGSDDFNPPFYDGV